MERDNSTDAPKVKNCWCAENREMECSFSFKGDDSEKQRLRAEFADGMKLFYDSAKGKVRMVRSDGSPA